MFRLQSQCFASASRLRTVSRIISNEANARSVIAKSKMLPRFTKKKDLQIRLLVNMEKVIESLADKGFVIDQVIQNLISIIFKIHKKKQ
ncbi:hypothetical protein CLOM_g11015 [Closterium sp. NIES-68]|nr:hypothetical protein CLOM_g11015 [Closterium sp. NIES-68]